ncbi:MAG: ABC transporter ATP-binding protein [Anaerolineales bacterium]
MPHLELRTVTKRFNKTLAVKDLSFAVDRGEFLSLLGPSGCGKSTTLRMIAGLESPDSGRVILDGIQLSGGQQQRVALARALAPEPNLLLLDEPLSALDAMVRLNLRGEIRRIQSELGITTVYVTHDQEEALSISDQVAVMREGTIEQIGTPEEIYRNPRNRFLASFIGTANQFSGLAINDHTIQGENYTFKSEVPVELLGKPVVVLVRPENIQVHSESEQVPEGCNLITGEIQTITFMGSVTRLTVNVFGERVVCDVPVNEHHYEHNQRVRLAIPPEFCQIMAD